MSRRPGLSWIERSGSLGEKTMSVLMFGRRDRTEANPRKWCG
jgi:hypothetical protein